MTEVLNPKPSILDSLAGMWGFENLVLGVTFLQPHVCNASYRTVMCM